jgi:PAS domain S-box-containing protein
MVDQKVDFRLIVDSIPGLVFTYNPRGEIEFVNRQLLDYLGRTLEGLQAGEGGQAVHPDDKERVTRAWRENISAGRAHTYEERLRRADGVYLWFQLRCSPSFDADGRLVRWYGCLTDIDALKRADDASRANERALSLVIDGLVTDIDDLKRAQEASHVGERNLRLLIDSIPGLVATMTPACELESVNSQVLEYFGRTFEELREWDRYGCVHQDDMPRVRESLRRTIEFGEPHEVEQRLRRADGAYRWFKPRSYALRDTDGSIRRWYMLLSDIDDLKRAEEDLRSLQARLSRASQLATISELAASIAHEVNQPLAALIANGHAGHRWLSADPPNVERALLSVERIIRDGNSAAEIVSRIRSLFRHAPPAKQRLSLNEVIEEVCRLIADDLRRKGIALKLALQPDLPAAEADRVQMQQVIANLARNGIDAMDTVHGRHKELAIASTVADGEIAVHVSDAGEGLRDAEAVFEPFFTTKASGMGMGLAICKSILDAHGGRLWARQNPAHGATFAFSLRIDSGAPE